MLTASIVLYKNSLKECHQVLDSLLASPCDKIYLVDHSPDDSLRCLEQISERISYIPHENSGYGSGHNVAIRRALAEKSDYHLLLNADIYFDCDVIPALLEYMQNNPGVGLTMPRVIYPDGRLQKLCKRLPTPLDLFSKRFLPGAISDKLVRRLCLDDFDYEHILNVPWLSGCFMFCRCSTLNEVGGFDERFFMYGEDIDLSRRFHAISGTMYYPEVTIVHNHAAASYRSWRMLAIHMGNLFRYFTKWGWLFDAERRRVNRVLTQEIMRLAASSATKF